jgi:hypothetical protein
MRNLLCTVYIHDKDYIFPPQNKSFFFIFPLIIFVGKPGCGIIVFFLFFGFGWQLGCSGGGG